MPQDEKDVLKAEARYEETRRLASTSESEKMGKTSSSFRSPEWASLQTSPLPRLWYKVGLAFWRPFQLNEPESKEISV
jgi:hypothetical protein